MHPYQQFARRLLSGSVDHDLALLNLVCAHGLPGARVMDIEVCLRTINSWTHKVRYYTNELLRQYHREPSDYYSSEPYFRMLCLVTCLQRNCGVHYNLAKISPDAVFEAADSFIFGIVQGNGGTCATMPVVYTAIGRRLGYPLKLVDARGGDANHTFVRWDDPNGVRFNIEATAQGMSCHPDDYYRAGLYTTTAQDERRGCFLRSMSPREEFASFLGQAFHCWKDVGNFRFAADAMATAYVLCPDNDFFRDTLNTTLSDWQTALRNRQPNRFPEIMVESPKRRFPLAFPVEIEKQILGLEALENMLNDKEQDQNWWEPMRQGRRLSKQPREAYVKFDEYNCSIQFEFDRNGYCYDSSLLA